MVDALRNLGNWLGYLAVRGVMSVVMTLDIESCRWWCQLLAWTANDLLRIRRKVVSENLARAFPERSPAERLRLARTMWEHLLLMVCELAHMQRKLHETNWRRYIRMDQREEIVSSLLDARPTVMVSGHLGNFELGCYLVGMLGFRGYAIARPLDNPYLDRFVRRFRESRGQYILDKDGCAQQVADLLAAGETLFLLGDQYAGPKGCWVDFFGHPASYHKGVALFTLTSGAPMLVMAVTRQRAPMQYAVELVGQADARSLPAEMAHVKGLTRWYNANLERSIRRYPAQYWWLHRRWKGQPPDRAGRKADGPGAVVPEDTNASREAASAGAAATTTSRPAA